MVLSQHRGAASAPKSPQLALLTRAICDNLSLQLAES